MARVLLIPPGVSNTPPTPSARPPRPARRAQRGLVAALFGTLILSDCSHEAAGEPSSLSGKSWERLALAARGPVSALAVASGSARLAVGDERGVRAGSGDDAPPVVLRRGPVRDLLFLPDGFEPGGLLLAATDRGLYSVDFRGRVESLVPGAGESVRVVTRLAVAAGVVAAATEGGAFVSTDTRRWQRLHALPAGPVTAIALRGVVRGVECWAVAGGALWRTTLLAGPAGLTAERPVRELIPFSSGGDAAVEIRFDLPGSDSTVVFPTALAVRRAAGDPWRLLRPNLPPGASALRLVAALGRLWLGTDRGLLEAPDLEGPWTRAAAPAGTAPVTALAGGARRLYAATDAGLFAGAHGTPLADRAARHALLEFGEPPVGAVHRAALAYLDLGSVRLRELRRGVERRGWLPLVVLRFGHDRDRRWGTDRDEAFTSGELRHLVDRDSNASRETEYSVSLSWDLGDVAYHPEEIDVSRESREVMKLRDDVLDEITQLYFDRRRVLQELTALDPAAPEAAPLHLRAAELAAGIDSWTGGWFSRHLEGVIP